MRSQEFGDQGVPLRGTFYKSQNGLTGGTWINRSFGQPYFNESTEAFSVNTREKVKKEDGLKISRDTLERLAITRPEHRITRIKFDQTVAESLAQKNNKTMTVEDNIHENETEAIFRNSLR